MTAVRCIKYLPGYHVGKSYMAKPGTFGRGKPGIGVFRRGIKPPNDWLLHDYLSASKFADHFSRRRTPCSTQAAAIVSQLPAGMLGDMARM